MTLYIWNNPLSEDWEDPTNWSDVPTFTALEGEPVLGLPTLGFPGALRTRRPLSVVSTLRAHLCVVAPARIGRSQPPRTKPRLPAEVSPRRGTHVRARAGVFAS
jgi:hypothetical protein